MSGPPFRKNPAAVVAEQALRPCRAFERVIAVEYRSAKSPRVKHLAAFNYFTPSFAADGLRSA